MLISRLYSTFRHLLGKWNLFSAGKAHIVQTRRKMPENVKLLHSAFPLAGTVLNRTETTWYWMKLQRNLPTQVGINRLCHILDNFRVEAEKSFLVISSGICSPIHFPAFGTLFIFLKNELCFIPQQTFFFITVPYRHNEDIL